MVTTILFRLAGLVDFHINHSAVVRLKPANRCVCQTLSIEPLITLVTVLIEWVFLMAGHWLLRPRTSQTCATLKDTH